MEANDQNLGEGNVTEVVIIDQIDTFILKMSEIKKTIEKEGT